MSLPAILLVGAACRPWFTHGGSLLRDRSQVLRSKQALDCALASGVFIPVTAGGQSIARRKQEGLDELEPFLLEGLTGGELQGTVWAWLGQRAYDRRHVFALTLDHQLKASYCEGSDIVQGPLRQLAEHVTSPDDAALLSTAQGLMHFHNARRFCARCGGATESYKVGAGRMCTACGVREYPRVDPASIVLVTSPRELDGGSHALLGRKASWLPGRWSALSGFAELGESVEENLVREVREESGVVVRPDTLRYVASQPWLFPHTVLLGFMAEAEPVAGGRLPPVNVDEDELEDVRWFSRDFVRRAIAGGEGQWHVPSKVSLAHILVHEWLAAPPGQP